MTFRTLTTSLAVLTFFFIGTVQAQQRVKPAAPDQPFAWSRHLGEQLAASLVSPTASVRESALHQVTYFATYEPGLDLSKTVPVLVDLYRNDPDDHVRMAATAALFALGNEDGLQQVRLHVISQPADVQVAALGALMRHYGPATFEGAADMARLAERLQARHAEPAPEIATR